MEIPRYDDAICAQKPTNYDMWYITQNLSRDNIRAQRACLNCPARTRCHDALMQTPQLYEGQIRAGQAITRDLIRKLAIAEHAL